MNSTIALTQFVFLALGIMALNLIVKVTHQPSPLAHFLASQGWWLIILPVLWMAFDRICQAWGRGIFRPGLARVSGILLAAAIFGCYAFVIFFPK